MARRIITFLLACGLAVAALAGCASTTVSTDTVSTGAGAASSGASSVASTGSSATAASVLAENGAPETIGESAAEGEGVVQITLEGGSIASAGAGVTVEGSTATITAAGTYQIGGTLDDGQLIVDTDDAEPVYLVLAGASISSSTSAPIYVKEAAAVEVVLADGAENVLSDAATYVYASADEDEPNAALFSDDTLVISGSGALTVEANYNDGIASKNGLTVEGGTLNVTAADDGIRGKDYLVVEGGSITVTAGGDGLSSDNADDLSLGYIAIAGGALNITAAGDGMQATTDLVVSAGEISVVAGGGSGAALSADVSAKGLKAASLTLEGGRFAIDAAEDALHADGDLTVSGGTFSLAAGDDGIHAEASLTVNGGAIQVTESYEGLEGANIVLNAGSVALVSSDDGVNAAGGDGSAEQGGFGGPGGGPGGGSYSLTINGGTLVLDSAGDGLDANGTITMTDGLVVVNGPVERMNGALDVDGGFTVSGGTLVAVGSSGMAQAPGASSSQNALLLFFDQAQQAGTLIHIVDSAGSPVLTFAPSKSYQSLAFSSPALTTGETYAVYLGGSTTGGASDGLSTGGSYSGGTLYTSFTVEGVVTQVGSGGGRFR